MRWSCPPWTRWAASGPSSYTSSNASVAFHLRSGGVGAAFGKLADSAALQCAWDASFDSDMTVVRC